MLSLINKFLVVFRAFWVSSLFRRVLIDLRPGWLDCTQNLGTIQPLWVQINHWALQLCTYGWNHCKVHNWPCQLSMSVVYFWIKSLQSTQLTMSGVYFWLKSLQSDISCVVQSEITGKYTTDILSSMLSLSKRFMVVFQAFWVSSLFTDLCSC